MRKLHVILLAPGPLLLLAPSPCRRLGCVLGFIVTIAVVLASCFCWSLTTCCLRFCCYYCCGSAWGQVQGWVGSNRRRASDDDAWMHRLTCQVARPDTDVVRVCPNFVHGRPLTNCVAALFEPAFVTQPNRQPLQSSTWRMCSKSSSAPAYVFYLSLFVFICLASFGFKSFLKLVKRV